MRPAVLLVLMPVLVSVPAMSSFFCSSPGVAIPPDGTVSDSQVVVHSQEVENLDVWLEISHTWGGDLTVALRNEATGTEVTLVDLPGAPARTGRILT